MVIKIFTKRLQGGKPVKTGLNWHNMYIEAEEISTRINPDKIEVMCFGTDNQSFKTIDPLTHGYELYNDAGVMIEKYVTAIQKEDE